MSDKPAANFTEKQQAWFASVRAGLERDTGKTLDAWVDIARACPETRQRAQLTWFKTHHGLGQNRAMQVLHAAFPELGGWDDPDALRTALWKDPGALAILTAVEDAITALPEVTPTQRKGYTAWSRRVQFAALKPLRGGQALLGLAVPSGVDPRLSPAKKESWSERLTTTVHMMTPVDISSLFSLLQKAWDGA